jgi:hypothetical protein
VCQENVRLCIDLFGLDERLVVPIALAHSEAFYDWAKRRFLRAIEIDQDDTWKQAVQLNPKSMSPPLLAMADSVLDLDSKIVQLLVSYHRFDLLSSNTESLLKALPLLPPTPRLLEMATQQLDYHRNHYPSIVTRFVQEACKHGRIDLLELVTFHDKFSVSQHAFRYDNLEVVRCLSSLLPRPFARRNYIPVLRHDRVDLFLLWQEVSGDTLRVEIAIEHGAVNIADHLWHRQESINFSTVKWIPTERCLDWCLAHGLEHASELQLLNAVSNGRVSEALLLLDSITSLSSLLWHRALTLLFRKQEIVFEDLERLVKRILSCKPLLERLENSPAQPFEYHAHCPSGFPFTPTCLRAIIGDDQGLTLGDVQSHSVLWLFALIGARHNPEGALRFLARAKQLGLISLLRGKSVQSIQHALAQVNNDQVWQFVLENVRKPTKFCNSFALGLISAQRLLWLAEFLPTIDASGTKPFSGKLLGHTEALQRFLSGGGRVSGDALRRAFDSNDWHALDLMTQARFGFSASVELSDQVHFSVLQHGIRFTWSWQCNNSGCGLSYKPDCAPQLIEKGFSTNDANCLTLLIARLFRLCEGIPHYATMVLGLEQMEQGLPDCALKELDLLWRFH